MAAGIVGVLAGQGPARAGDLEALRQADVETVKLRALVNPVASLTAYRDAGCRRFLVQLLSPRPGAAPTDPRTFIAEFAPAVREFLAAGVTDFEIHDAPNTPARGFGVSWDSPAGFSDWFLAVAEGLRAEFGPPLRVGFPGLAPGGALPPGVAPAVADDVFLDGCAGALAAADFVCCHVYWSSLDEMRSFHGALRFLRVYTEREGVWRKPVVISEFANVDPASPWAVKGDQYAEFYFLCSQYDRLVGAYAFLLRSPDPAYAGLTWIADDGSVTPLPARVAQRRRMPHPSRMRLAWPTVTRHYTQAYGDRQQVYYDASYDETYNTHWLHGGHEGVDLQAAEGSLVRACQGGRVTHGPPGTAYGSYVRVESQVPEVGTVTLLYGHLQTITASNGAQVEAGEVLGLAGRTGNVTGPHLHLGMKIAGVNLRPTSHYLNCRPYLDPVRGTPRQQYGRTVVLLPPGADSEWAQAVVAATWDRFRFTVGGSADDAGLGDLDFRRVVAVNPAAWGSDLGDFFATYYAGVIYSPLVANTPAQLAAALIALPEAPAPPPQPARRGLPRVQYNRTYVLLPPAAGQSWAQAVVEATWNRSRFTVGGSADDAGIGDLDMRRVIAVNPTWWNGDLLAFFERYYPGIVYTPLEAGSPDHLREKLT